MSGMVNPGEVLLKAVKQGKPERMHKMLIGLDQKVRGQGQGLQSSPSADGVPPAERHNLTRSVMSTEHGKPVVLPSGKASRKACRWDCGQRIGEKAKAAL
jgi:hypothetical protein